VWVYEKVLNILVSRFMKAECKSPEKCSILKKKYFDFGELECAKIAYIITVCRTGTILDRHERIL